MKKTKFTIKGIKCENCSRLIEERLIAKSGVLKIKVDRDSNKGVVIFDEQKVAEKDIYTAIEGINGFRLEKIEDDTEHPGIRKAKFRIEGLKCDNCAILIEDLVKTKPGVFRVKVDQRSKKGVVIYDRQKINEGDIQRAIEEIGGFSVEKLDGEEVSSEDSFNYDNPDLEQEKEPPVLG